MKTKLYLILVTVFILSLFTFSSHAENKQEQPELENFNYNKVQVGTKLETNTQSTTGINAYPYNTEAIDYEQTKRITIFYWGNIVERCNPDTNNMNSNSSFSIATNFSCSHLIPYLDESPFMNNNEYIELTHEQTIRYEKTNLYDSIVYDNSYDHTDAANNSELESIYGEDYNSGSYYMTTYTVTSKKEVSEDKPFTLTFYAFKQGTSGGGGSGGDNPYYGTPDKAMPDTATITLKKAPECGDDEVNGDEECDGDDTVTIENAHCTKECEIECDEGYTAQTSTGINGRQIIKCNQIFIAMHCGDGIVNGTEECDDGNRSNYDNCLNDCTENTCTDGYLNQSEDSFEECDDGNRIDDDECSNKCKKNQQDPVCGNGVVEEGEECDDGARISGDGCNKDCETEFCGDDVIQNFTDHTEECDDGNNDDNDGCNASCQKEYCGDSVLQAREQCEEDLDTTYDNTTQDCVNCKIDCKEGYHMTLDGDCEADEEEPFCGNGVVEEGEECDDANRNDRDACLVGCISATCGDGYVWTGHEQCDDGANINGDGCSADCKTETNTDPDPEEYCGDGIVQAGAPRYEQCEEGVTILGPEQECINCKIRCDKPECQEPDDYCGDGIVQTGAPRFEQCEPGVTTFPPEANEYCDPADCKIKCKEDQEPVGSCGDGTVQTELGEECEQGVTPLGDFEVCRACQIECIPGTTMIPYPTPHCEEEMLLCENGAEPVYALCVMTNTLTCYDESGNVITNFTVQNLDTITSSAVIGTSLYITTTDGYVMRMNFASGNTSLEQVMHAGTPLMADGISAAEDGTLITWKGNKLLAFHDGTIILRNVSAATQIKGATKDLSDSSFYVLADKSLYQIPVTGSVTEVADLVAGLPEPIASTITFNNAKLFMGSGVVNIISGEQWLMVSIPDGSITVSTANAYEDQNTDTPEALWMFICPNPQNNNPTGCDNCCPTCEVNVNVNVNVDCGGCCSDCEDDCQDFVYVCSDGSQVDDPSLCPVEDNETSVANSDSETDPVQDETEVTDPSEGPGGYGYLSGGGCGCSIHATGGSTGLGWLMSLIMLLPVWIRFRKR